MLYFAVLFNTGNLDTGLHRIGKMYIFESMIKINKFKKNNLNL